VIKPGSGAGSQTETWDFDWHHGTRDGYGFVPIGTKNLRAVLPGEVATLQLDNIEISNSSLQSALDAFVVVEIRALGAPKGVRPFAVDARMSLPSNSVRTFKRGPILVDEFRFNRATATEYALTVSAMSGTTVVDRHFLYFKIGSVTPALTSVDPERSQVGQFVRITGTGFGQLAKNNKITFNGTPATEVRSWSDTAIVVRVPANATSGPVVVTRGEVPSNGLPFTVVNYLSSQTFEAAWGVKEDSAEARAMITVEADRGGWYGVRQERSGFNPMSWLKLWFKTVPPSSGGGNLYRITANVTDLLIADRLGVQDGEIIYKWYIYKQEGGEPHVVNGCVVELTELEHWGALQVDLVLLYPVIKPGWKDPIIHQLNGLHFSFHPTTYVASQQLLPQSEAVLFLSNPLCTEETQNLAATPVTKSAKVPDALKSRMDRLASEIRSGTDKATKKEKRKIKAIGQKLKKLTARSWRNKNSLKTKEAVVVYLAMASTVNDLGALQTDATGALRKQILSWRKSTALLALEINKQQTSNLNQSYNSDAKRAIRLLRKLNKSLRIINESCARGQTG
jgi:hypothetical protein